MAKPTQPRPGNGTDASAGTAPHKDGDQRKRPSMVSRLTGFHVWAKQLNTFRNRASMPLLRRTIKNELVLNKTIISYEDIPDEVMEKTLVGHKFLFWFMICVLCWGVLTTVKGVSAGVRYDMWLNNWLAGGLPITVLAAARSFTSWKVMRGVEGALALRASSTQGFPGDRPCP